jgi:hypothetical protein
VLARFLRVVLFELGFLFVMVNVHEVGHTLFARLLGDDSAHYALYQAQGSSACMGCNLYDSSRLGDVANILVNFGGVASTQLLCWIAILMLAFPKPAVVRPWMLLSAVAITWSGDVVLQLAQGLAATVPVNMARGPERTYTDYQAVLWFLRDQTGVAASDLKAVLLLATIGYSTLLFLATRWALDRRRFRRTKP